MVLHVLRALFVLLMAGVGWVYRDYRVSLSLSVALTIVFIGIDILSPRRKLSVFAGTFFGLLVGLVFTYGLSVAIQLSVDLYYITNTTTPIAVKVAEREQLLQFLYLLTGVICCYIAISFILQTKDDFRFIIPYVEFSKQLRGPRPMIVDTSVIIDGRLNALASSGLIDSQLIVPRFVVTELQALADSADKLKRNRGRRGLDMLKALQADKATEVILYDWTGHSSPDAQGTDQKLLVLAKELNGRVMTNDVNLAKVAALRDVPVISINDLARALRPVALAGEHLEVTLIKPGEDAGQGVGYLEDGTMVVVDQGRPLIGQRVEIAITNVIQTATGQMVFGRPEEDSLANTRRANAKAEK